MTEQCRGVYPPNVITCLFIITIILYYFHIYSFIYSLYIYILYYVVFLHAPAVSAVRYFIYRHLLSVRSTWSGSPSVTHLPTPHSPFHYGREETWKLLLPGSVFQREEPSGKCTFPSRDGFALLSLLSTPRLATRYFPQHQTQNAYRGGTSALLSGRPIKTALASPTDLFNLPLDEVTQTLAWTLEAVSKTAFCLTTHRSPRQPGKL
ncbi:hypothetical protein E2C01_042058 [Portunus trituberculatus]|uniref:Uncharacterized protein n=1 Tax=Portunus trituberculatus TaxID=210409 RepID=A0A5B7FKS7_PORTR|nr:hypothetical protein [Portunus trituberculatus]